MTYEEFKKELRWNVQNMETARGKTIRLLERHMVCGDPMAVHIMNIMNRCMYGREQIMIREDMLCALWMRGKREYIQHWLCLLYTSPSPRDRQKSRMPSSA